MANAPGMADLLGKSSNKTASGNHPITIFDFLSIAPFSLFITVHVGNEQL